MFRTDLNPINGQIAVNETFNVILHPGHLPQQQSDDKKPEVLLRTDNLKGPVTPLTFQGEVGVWVVNQCNYRAATTNLALVVVIRRDDNDISEDVNATATTTTTKLLLVKAMTINNQAFIICDNGIKYHTVESS